MTEIMKSHHWRSFFENKFIGAWDFIPGKDVVVVIERVERGELSVPGTRQKSIKPVIYFKGTTKGFALNKTNSKTIAALYGNDVRAWEGKPIAIYATETNFGDERVQCIRVRPKVPRKQAPRQEQSAPSVPDPGEYVPPEPPADYVSPDAGADREPH